MDLLAPSLSPSLVCCPFGRSRSAAAQARPLTAAAGATAETTRCRATQQPDSPGIEAVNVGDPTSPALMGASAETFALSGFAFSRWAVHAVSEFSGFDTFAPCQGPLFADDFESGNTTAWSSTVP